MNKAIIIVDSLLPAGLKANVAAVLSLSLGAQAPDLVGGPVSTRDGEVLQGITTTPISILQAEAGMIGAIYEKQRGSDLRIWIFNDCAAKTKNYDDYTQALAGCDASAMEFLGILVFGDKKAVNKISGSLQLMR